MSATSVPRRATAAPPGVERLLGAARSDRPAGLPEHLARLGPLEAGRSLVEEVARSGLRGHGGAAFDAGTKLRSVAGSRGHPVVVANGVEGEPASAKDKALIRLEPHLVFDGIVAAAAAVGARDGVLTLANSARVEYAVASRALAERTDVNVRLRLARAPDGFVTGEETALLNALGGGEPKPTSKPPYPFERGLFGAPTLVHNVETLAHIALIARFGAEWFRRLGSLEAPGTALVTLRGGVRRPGVYEIELGSTAGSVIRRAGGAAEPLSAILIGGYFGRWFELDECLDLPLLPGVLGAGTLVALPANVCGIAESARVIRYLARESAGQCGPCIRGLDSIAGALEGLGSNGDLNARQRLERWAGQVRGRGACRHPDGAAGFVESAIAVFRSEFDRHAAGRRCRTPGRAVLPVPARRR